jgi:hypothetical protein
MIQAYQKYPLTFAAGVKSFSLDYTIELVQNPANSTWINIGTFTLPDNGQENTIDVSPILRRYVAVNWDVEPVSLSSSFSTGLFQFLRTTLPNGTIISPTISIRTTPSPTTAIATNGSERFVYSFGDASFGTGGSGKYTIIHDYCYINRFLHPRQVLSVSAYSTFYGEGSYLIDFKVNGNTVKPLTFTDEIFFYSGAAGCMLNLGYYSVREGDTIDFSIVLGGKRIFKIGSPCDNYVLYYVNKSGGRDSIQCSGNTGITYTASERTDAMLYDESSTVYDITRKRLSQRIQKRYTLHTTLIDGDRLQYVDNLIFTPKCWLVDFNQSTPARIPCLIDTSSVRVLNKGDNLWSYTFDVIEANEQIRM